jgi:hypothetical protein
MSGNTAGRDRQSIQILNRMIDLNKKTHDLRDRLVSRLADITSTQIPLPIPDKQKSQEQWVPLFDDYRMHIEEITDVLNDINHIIDYLEI